MTSPVSGMLAKAHRALQTARVALNDGDAEGSINRAYYAAFYMAGAALYLVGEQPKTHAGVANRFRVRFVDEGAFPHTLAKALHTGLRARTKADYDFIGVFDTFAAADLLRDVEAFVQAAEALVRDLEAGGQPGRVTRP